MVLVEGKLRSWGRAELVIKLLDQDLPEAYSRIAGSSQEDADYCLDDVIEAVRNCRDRRSALVYLMQECQICLAHYPMSKVGKPFFLFYLVSVCLLSTCHLLLIDNV